MPNNQESDSTDEQGLEEKTDALRSPESSDLPHGENENGFPRIDIEA